MNSDISGYVIAPGAVNVGNSSLMFGEIPFCCCEPGSAAAVLPPRFAFVSQFPFAIFRFLSGRSTALTGRSLVDVDVGVLVLVDGFQRPPFLLIFLPCELSLLSLLFAFLVFPVIQVAAFFAIALVVKRFGWLIDDQIALEERMIENDMQVPISHGDACHRIA